MRSFFKVAVIGLGALASVSAAEAMPAVAGLSTAQAVSADHGLIQKTVVVVTTRRRVVRRPARVVRRVIIR